MKKSFLFGDNQGAILTHYLIVISAVLAMCMAAPILHLKWSVYLGIALLFMLVFHHAFKTTWSWRFTWFLGIFTFIIFLLEGAA